MGLFDQFPYTNFHELNLDWLLRMIKELNNTVENFVALNTIKYADPIQWNITTQYEKNTIVIEPNSGTAYISVQPVPSGVSIGNTDYWTVVFSLGAIIDSINNNLTNHIDNNVTTATFNSSISDWLIWNDELYLVTAAINAGDAYTIGSNIERKSVEELVKDYIALITSAINDIVADVGDLSNLTTTDKSSLVSAINEIITIIGALSNLLTTDKSSVVNAINEVVTNIGDLSSLNTSDKSSVVNAINEVFAMIGSGTTWASVKDYGAVGDGVTDDSAAIQACIDANDVAYFPKGNYLSKMLKVHDNSYLLGDNATLTLPLGLDSTDLIGELETNYDFQMSANIYGDSVDSVTIRGFIINGQVLGRSTDAVQKADGIFFFNSSNIKIYDVYITESLSHGFELYRCSDSIIENCRSDHSGEGKKEYLVGGGDSFVLHARCENCSIVNCYSYYSWDIGFEMEGRGVDSWANESIRKCSLINCSVKYSRDHAFLILNAIGSQIADCKADYTHYLSSAPWNDGAAFCILGGLNNTLTNNISRHATKYNLTITDEDTGNNPSTIQVVGFNAESGGGICIRNAFNCDISDVRLYTNAARLANADIYIEGSSRISLTNIRNGNQMNYGIYAVSSYELSITNFHSRATVYGLFSNESTGIVNILDQMSGTRAVGITGSATAYLILNNVTEIQTSGDITTSYGGYSFVRINSHTYIT